MLRELRIRDFAVVEELALEFGPGLSVLSGETGAGKSILVEALALLVGGRPSPDMIRVGKGRSLIEGRFEVAGAREIEELCDEAGLEIEDGWLILRRELRREGRHRAWVNGSPSTTTFLRTLGARLLDLHGQHEHQRLLDRGEQRRILDAYGEHGDLADALAGAWDELRHLEVRLAEVKETARQGRERADYLRFKAEEIGGSGLGPAEDEELEIQSRRLTHSEELIEISGALYDRLYDSERSIVDQLGELAKRLLDLVDIDETARRFLDLHVSALRSLEELGRELGPYRADIEHDPGRLAEIRGRQDLLYRLKRKYGDTLETVIQAGAEAERELAGIDGADEEISRLVAQRGEAVARVEKSADELSAARGTAAATLGDAVSASLPALGLEGGQFVIQLTPLDSPGRHGTERIEFLVSLNPGFPPGPLSRVASGGEMSRLMLAVETALVAIDDVPILIFDEIDAGIGGAVAHRVAERLVQVAASHQVLVVTHLAQIAARADAHYSVGKAAEGGETRTSVRELAGHERVQEMARMLGGDPDSDASRAHAEELLTGQP